MDNRNPRAFRERPWDRPMLRFLVRQRRRGQPIRWIAEKLGVSLIRAVAKAVNLGLTLGSAYRGRRRLGDAPEPIAPLGPIREIPDDALCRWIDADTNGPWRMCARPTAKGSAWCAHHRQQVYIARRRPPASVMAGPDDKYVSGDEVTP